MAQQGQAALEPLKLKLHKRDNMSSIKLINSLVGKLYPIKIENREEKFYKQIKSTGLLSDSSEILISFNENNVNTNFILISESEAEHVLSLGINNGRYMMFEHVTKPHSIFYGIPLTKFDQD